MRPSMVLTASALIFLIPSTAQLSAAADVDWTGWLGPERNGWVRDFQPPIRRPERLAFRRQMRSFTRSWTMLPLRFDWAAYSAMFSTTAAFAQDISPAHEGVRNEGKARQAADAATRAAETVLLYQRHTGGWPKNYDRKQNLTEEERKRLIADKSRTDSTIDNGATHTEIRLLSDAYRATEDERFKDAAIRGVEYLLDAQYDNGGWPQSYPHAKGYAKHITFNDNAMIGVMSLLRDIADDGEQFSFVPPATRNRCAEAVERGVGCILKCQIVVDGQPTAWCAQHDEATLEPRKARSYELASLSGSESVGIVRFLMQIDDPRPEIVSAIDAAVGWFERAKLRGIKLVRVDDQTLPKGYDKAVVADPNAPPMWARFYDIQTNKPIYCSRDGIPRATLAEISYERRNGYSWLGYYAEDLWKKSCPFGKDEWSRQVTQSENAFIPREPWPLWQ